MKAQKKLKEIQKKFKSAVGTTPRLGFSFKDIEKIHTKVISRIVNLEKSVIIFL